MKDPAERTALIRRYGDFSLAASIDQPGIRLFGNADGAIAFKEMRSGGHFLRCALGDPLAPAEDWPELVARFISETPNVVLANVGEQLGALLSRNRMYLNQLGTEAILDLKGGYDLSGKKKQNIRNAVHRAAADGFRVDEISPEDDNGWEQIHLISHQWLHRKGRGRPENTFITRPLLRRGRFQRIFVMRHSGGRIVQFLTFDEMWRDGKIVGYHANINRAADEAPKNADYVAIARMIELAQDAGIPSLSLGLCPSSAPTAGKYANLYTDVFWRMARRHGGRIYAFEGITQHKEEFRPTIRRPVFVATQEPWPMADIFGVLKASNLI